MNLLLLMSGSSEAFKEAGLLFPKNLTEIAGKPLVQCVLEQLAPLRQISARTICTLRAEENSKHHTGAVLRLIDPSVVPVLVNGTTSGAACTALLAVEHIDNDAPLVIVNGDQLIEADLPAALADFQRRNLDGGIIVFDDVHPRWSFVKCDAEDRVIEAAEKRPISRLATAGFYYFKKGRDFVLAATEMIKKDAQVNELFYICPAYNELILRQRAIGVHRIARKAYRTLASPADVHSYAAYLEAHST